MARPRRWSSDQERRNAQSDRRRYERSGHPVQFVAVDGEGQGDGPDHKYVLLGVGDEYISSKDGLSFSEICEFLYSQYLLYPKAAFVGFFLGYDFNQWLKTLPENRAWYLLTAEGRARRARRLAHLGPFPVHYEGWQFDILGMKRFRLRPEGAKGWMYICDAGSFFQTSLMKVIDPKEWADPVCTEEEYAILEEGKARRDSAVLGPDMVRYNRLENDVLARVMGRLNVGFTSAGIRLKKSQWFGPGQAAQEWMGSTELPTVGDLESLSENAGLAGCSSPLEAGRLTYYGGWFEIFAHGHIPGRSYEYDINSAYPYIASRLPCLLHGQWTSGFGAPGDLPGNSIRIVHARVTGTDRHLGAMLHRMGDGSIRRPSSTGGWYWQAELDAAVRAGAISSIDHVEWIQYDPCECRGPLRGIVGLYDRRIRAGKNSPEGKALKLIYNSMYGKLAQSIGNPKYGNAIYASLITSGCRRMILDAIATHPEGTNQLLMVATDGVYFRTPHVGLVLSNRLGDWEMAVKENLTLFKPGVYWDDHTRRQLRNGEVPSFKARGISARAFGRHLTEVDDLFGQWDGRYPSERDPAGPRDGWFPQVTFTSGFSMITCLQALQRHKWHLAGAVRQDVELTQDADPISKRHSGWYEDGVYWSRPYPDGGWQEESTPYDERFGQPDAEEYGITPDGTVLDLWKGMLNG